MGLLYYVLQSLQVVTRQLLPKMLFPLQIAVIPKMHKSFIRISLIIVLSKKEQLNKLLSAEFEQLLDNYNHEELTDDQAKEEFKKYSEAFEGIESVKQHEKT